MDEGVESCSYQQFDQKSATLSDFRNHRCIGANPGASNLRSRVPVSVSDGWQATRRLSAAALAKADHLNSIVYSTVPCASSVAGRFFSKITSRP